MSRRRFSTAVLVATLVGASCATETVTVLAPTSTASVTDRSVDTSETASTVEAVAGQTVTPYGEYEFLLAADGSYWLSGANEAGTTYERAYDANEGDAVVSPVDNEGIGWLIDLTGVPPAYLEDTHHGILAQVLNWHLRPVAAADDATWNADQATGLILHRLEESVNRDASRETHEWQVTELEPTSPPDIDEVQAQLRARKADERRNVDYGFRPQSIEDTFKTEAGRDAIQAIEQDVGMTLATIYVAERPAAPTPTIGIDDKPPTVVATFRDGFRQLSLIELLVEPVRAPLSEGGGQLLAVSDWTSPVLSSLDDDMVRDVSNTARSTPAVAQGYPTHIWGAHDTGVVRVIQTSLAPDILGPLVSIVEDDQPLASW